jgi:uncharacterized protein HemY
MKLFEVTVLSKDSEELAALTQFLLSRADDTGSRKKISVAAFLKIAADMGISFTRDQLLNQVSQPPLNNLIANVEGDEIVFKGDDTADATMSVTKAQDVVGKMSKRALNKRD